MGFSTNIPKQLGDFDMLARIGRGPEGETWRARYRTDSSERAVKVLSPQYADDPRRVERFGHEAKLAQSLSHANIVRVYDVVEPPEAALPFFAMDFLPGGDIGQMRGCPADDVSRLVNLLAQVCDALEYIHQRGLVHCDVKPSNILLDGQKHPFLTDFGMTASAEDLAIEGSHGGTIQYMSPEQFESLSERAEPHRPVDARSDTYSIGVVLYDLLTGELPFQGTNRYALMYQRMFVDAQAPSARRADLSREIDDVIMRAIQRDPEDRFQTAANLAAALRALCA